LLLVSCGGPEEQQGPIASKEEPLTVPSSARISNCNEMFSSYYVDPTAAKNDVPAGYMVKIYPNGKALLLVMVQECGDVVLMGFLDVGGVHMSHVWIELEGPAEVPPILPGTTGAYPTRYWYAQPMQMNNLIAQQAMSLVGIDTQWVPYLTNGGAAAAVRQGKVIQLYLPWVQYAWTEKSTLWPAPIVVTGRQRFYRKYGLFGEYKSEGMVTCFSRFLGDSTVTLSAGSGSQVRKLNFGSTLYGTANPVHMDYCDADFAVHIWE